MQLDKDTLRKLRGLIIFTLVILVGLWRFSIVLQTVKTILHILFPFLLGGAIAFVLSVPMNRIRKRLFANAKEKPKKFAAPVSLILTLIFVLALLSLVTIVVVPELGNTIATLGKTLPEKVPVLIRKAEQLVSNHPELVDYIDEVQAQLNWEEILNQLVTFFRIGANSMLSSTISVATGIVSGVGTFFIGLVFACYILLQQEFLKRQMKKLIFAYLKEKHANRFLQICALTYRTFSNFLTGQCLEAVILGMMFFVKDHAKALSMLFKLIITGMIVMSVVSFGQPTFHLSPVIWLFIQSICLYIVYLTFQTIFFDRFIACFQIKGNVGFFIVTTDFLGYTGTVLVLVIKEFLSPDIHWATFYNQLAGYVGIFCGIMFLCSYIYLYKRSKNSIKEKSACKNDIQLMPNNAMAI